MRSDQVPWALLYGFVEEAARRGMPATFVVEAEIEELPPEQGDQWVRRRDTGRRTITIRSG